MVGSLVENLVWDLSLGFVDRSVTLQHLKWTGGHGRGGRVLLLDGFSCHCSPNLSFENNFDSLICQNFHLTLSFSCSKAFKEHRNWDGLKTIYWGGLTYSSRYPTQTISRLGGVTYPTYKLKYLPFTSQCGTQLNNSPFGRNHRRTPVLSSDTPELFHHHITFWLLGLALISIIGGLGL